MDVASSNISFFILSTGIMVMMVVMSVQAEFVLTMIGWLIPLICYLPISTTSDTKTESH